LPLPTEVRGTAGELPEQVSTAVWFCCTEALQNVVKHAGASRAWVVVDEVGSGGDHRLRFEVGDDGCGLPAAGVRPGSGMQNMADRLEALGGRLQVLSGGGGTRLVGDVPAAAVPAARSAADAPSVAVTGG
jgi:two-component system NarL family sensor kinase